MDTGSGELVDKLPGRDLRHDALEPEQPHPRMRHAHILEGPDKSCLWHGNGPLADPEHSANTRHEPAASLKSVRIVRIVAGDLVRHIAERAVSTECRVHAHGECLV